MTFVRFSLALLSFSLVGCAAEPQQRSPQTTRVIEASQQRRLFDEAHGLVLIEDSLAFKRVQPSPKLQDELIKLLNSDFVASREYAASILGIFFKERNAEVSDALKSCLAKEHDVQACMYMIVALRNLSYDNKDFVDAYLSKLHDQRPHDYKVLISILPDSATPSDHKMPRVDSANDGK